VVPAAGRAGWRGRSGPRLPPGVPAGRRVRLLVQPASPFPSSSRPPVTA
jgi:hypothetical protein